MEAILVTLVLLCAGLGLWVYPAERQIRRLRRLNDEILEGSRALADLNDRILAAHGETLKSYAAYHAAVRCVLGDMAPQYISGEEAEA